VLVRGHKGRRYELGVLEPAAGHAVADRQDQKAPPPGVFLASGGIAAFPTLPKFHGELPELRRIATQIG
jgi:hypothetical protein